MSIEQKEQVLNLIISGHYILTHHAYQRMQERSITGSDIRECARTTKKIELQDGDKFKIQGLDLTDVETTIICALKDNVVIITVF